MSISIVDALKLISISIISFVTIVVVLRISGKRTLSKMNAFDFIVTVALGSVLATTIVNYQNAFWNGLLTIIMLVSLQFVATWLSVRYKPIRSILKSEPTLLFYDGEFLHKELKEERITRGELKQGIRKSGFVSFEEISAIILEADGTLTVMRKSDKNKIQKDDFIFIE